VDGDAVVSETLRVELAPYHTRGTQSVIVQVGGETFTLVPDNAYLRANITETRPVGVAVDPAGNRAYLARLAASATTVIPGHDPALGEHFEVLGAGIIRLATSDDREDQ
jgi:glyoxylase-like metal-dependent hydrolase (beta-lactamase superfamily II)